MNTHVIHYKKLTDRKKYLEPLLKNVVWHYSIDRDTIGQHEIDKFYTADSNLWYNRCQNLYKDIPPYRELKTGDICCSIAHIESWNYFLLNDTEDWALFLEDDAVLCEDFYEKLDNIMAIKPDCDMIFIGGGFSHEVAPTISQSQIGDYLFIEKGHPATNCLCSYLINKNTAKKLMDHFLSEKFVLPIDFEMNFFLRESQAKVFHILPMICIEGTSIGKYKSVQTR